MPIPAVTCDYSWIPLPTQGNTYLSVWCDTCWIGLDVRMPQQGLNPTQVQTLLASCSFSMFLPSMRLYPIFAHSRHRTLLPPIDPSILDFGSVNLITNGCRV